MGRASAVFAAAPLLLSALRAAAERPAALRAGGPAPLALRPAPSGELAEHRHAPVPRFEDREHYSAPVKHVPSELHESQSQDEEESGVIANPADDASQALKKLETYYDPNGGEVALLLDKMKMTDWKLNRAAWNWTRKNVEALKGAHHLIVQATNNASTKYFQDGLRFNQAIRQNLLNETKAMDALSLDERARQRILRERTNGSRLELPPGISDEGLIGKRVQCIPEYNRKYKELVAGKEGKIVSLVPSTNKFRIRLKSGVDFMPTLFKSEFIILPDHPEFDGVPMTFFGDYIDVPDEAETERLQILAIYEGVPVRIDHVPDHLIRRLHEDDGKDAEVLYLHKIGHVHNFRRNSETKKGEFQIKLEDMEEEDWPWLTENTDFHRCDDLNGQEVMVNKVSKGTGLNRTVLRAKGTVTKWHPERGGYYTVEIPSVTVNVRPNEIRRDRSLVGVYTWTPEGRAWAGPGGSGHIFEQNPGEGKVSDTQLEAIVAKLGPTLGNPQSQVKAGHFKTNGYSLDEEIPDLRKVAPHGKMLLHEEVTFLNPEKGPKVMEKGVITGYNEAEEAERAEDEEAGPLRPEEYVYKVAVASAEGETVEEKTMHYDEFTLTSPKWRNRRNSGLPPEWQAAIPLGERVRLHEWAFPRTQVGNGLGEIIGRAEPLKMNPMLSENDDASIYTIRLLDRAHLKDGPVEATRDKFEPLQAMRHHDSALYDARGFILAEAAQSFVGHVYVVAAPHGSGLSIPSLHLESGGNLLNYLPFYVDHYESPNFYVRVPGLKTLKSIPSDEIDLSRDAERLDSPNCESQLTPEEHAVVMIKEGDNKGQLAQLGTGGPEPPGPNAGTFMMHLVAGSNAEGTPMLGAAVHLPRAAFVPMTREAMQTLTEWTQYLKSTRQLCVLSAEELEGKQQMKQPTNTASIAFLDRRAAEMDVEPRRTREIGSSESLGSSMSLGTAAITEELTEEQQAELEEHCADDLMFDAGFGDDEHCCDAVRDGVSENEDTCHSCKCPARSEAKRALLA